MSNRNKLGRIYNMVQHATIGPPFLDETTVVDSNAQRGFMQSNPMPNPEQPETLWPEARKEGQPVDLRHLTSPERFPPHPMRLESRAVMAAFTSSMPT